MSNSPRSPSVQSLLYNNRKCISRMFAQRWTTERIRNVDAGTGIADGRITDRRYLLAELDTEVLLLRFNYGGGDEILHGRAEDITRCHSISTLGMDDPTRLLCLLGTLLMLREIVCSK